LEVLSGSVFPGPAESIRELIANAADGLSQLPQELQRHLEIRLSVRFTPEMENPGILEITDTGVGMTLEQVEAYLGRLFATSKEGTPGVIGHFGIGFYSCFRLCQRVEVRTRSRGHGDSGTRMIYCGGDCIQVDTSDEVIETPGTTVALHLLKEYRQLLETATLTHFVRRYCNFVPYPIYVEQGHDLLNEMHAPWDRQWAREQDLAHELHRLFGIKSPLAIFPLEPGRDGHLRMQGFLYIPAPGEVHTLRLFSHRVLITEQERTLLEERLRRFVSGVINADDLPLVLSRDGIVESAVQSKAARKRLADIIANSLAAFAKNRREDFRRVMGVHGVSVKDACLKNDLLRRNLCDYLPFRSSMRSSVTIPEYVRQRAQRVVIYADDQSSTAALIPLYNRANVEVLYMTDAIDRPLRECWLSNGPPIEFRRVDASPPASEGETVAARAIALDPTLLEIIRDLFRAELNSRLTVEIRDLGEDAPPAILALDEDVRKRLTMVHIVHRFKQENRLHELPPEMQKAAKAGFFDFVGKFTDQTLILNRSNSIVCQLIAQLAPRIPHPMPGSRSFPGRSYKDPSPVACATDLHLVCPLIARFLHGQALLSSGLPLTNEELAGISQNQTVLISKLLTYLNPKNQGANNV